MSESLISKQSEQEDFLKFKINNLAKPKNNGKKLKPISQIKNTLSLFKKKDYQNEELDKSIIDSKDYLEEQDDFQYNDGKKIFKKLPPLSRNHVKLKDNEIFIELRIHEKQNFHNVLKSYKDEINKYFFNKYGKVVILANPIYITEKQKQVILVNLKKTDNSEALETDLIDKIYETFKKGQQKLKNIEFKCIYRQDIKPEDLEVDNFSKNEIKSIENSQIIKKSQLIQRNQSLLFGRMRKSQFLFEQLNQKSFLQNTDKRIAQQDILQENFYLEPILCCFSEDQILEQYQTKNQKDLLTQIKLFLSSQEIQLFIILGEAGVGKSSFLDKFLIPMQNQQESDQEYEYKKNTKIYRYLQEEIQKNQDKNKNIHFFLIKLLYFNSMDGIQDRVQLLYNSVQDPQKDKIVFLVDGYNEFPMEKFDVVDVFLLEQFPQNKVILTSRTKYLSQSQIPLLFTFDNNIKGSLQKIKCVFMQRFYDFQVEKFIDLHLRNVAEINDKQQLLTQIKIIVQKFQFSRQAKELSRIPLYLRIFLDSYQDVYNKINKKFKLNEELTEKQQEYDSKMFQYNMRIAQINEQLKKLELNLKGQYYIESEQSQFSKEASSTKLFEIIFPLSQEQKSDQQYGSSLKNLEQTQKPLNLENVWEYQKLKLTSQKNSNQQNSKIDQNNHVGRNIQVSKSLYINQSQNKEVYNLSKIDYQNDLDDFSDKDGKSSNFSDPYSIQEHQLKQNALNKALKIASKEKIFQDGHKFPKLKKDITECLGQDEKEKQTNQIQPEKNQQNQFIDYSQIKEQKIREYQEKEKQIDIKKQQLLGIINKKEQSITQRQDIQLIEKRLEIKEQVKKLEIEKEEIKLKQVDLGQNLFEINQKNQHQKVNTEDIIQLRNKSFSRYYLYGKYIKKWIKQRVSVMGESQKQIILANIMKDNKQNKIFDEINIQLKNDYKLQQEGLSKNDDLLYKLCYGFNKKLIMELFKEEKLTWTQEFIKNNFWKTNKDFLGNLKTQMKKIGYRIKGLFKQRNNEDTEQCENQLQKNNINKDKSQSQQYYEEIQILINLSPFNEHIDGQADDIINEIINEIEQDILKIDSFLDTVRQKLILEKIQMQKDEKAKIEQRYQNKLLQKFQQKSDKNIQTPLSSKTDLVKQESSSKKIKGRKSLYSQVNLKIGNNIYKKNNIYEILSKNLTSLKKKKQRDLEIYNGQKQAINQGDTYFSYTHTVIMDFIIAEDFITFVNKCESKQLKMNVSNLQRLILNSRILAIEDIEIINLIVEYYNFNGRQSLLFLKNNILLEILKIAKNNKEKLFALSTNAATIYNAVNFSFSGKDLRNISMEAALLQQSFFMGSNLQGADLDFTYFYDANLNYANLNDTKMNEIQLGRPQEYIGHKSPVLSVTLIQQQKLQMASGDQQGYIKIWDIQTGEKKSQLNGHLGGVYALDSSKDGQFMVSGGADKIIKLWDLQTNTVVRQVKAHKFTVVSVRFSNDNMHIISGGKDDILNVWVVPYLVNFYLENQANRQIEQQQSQLESNLTNVNNKNSLQNSKIIKFEQIFQQSNDIDQIINMMGNLSTSNIKQTKPKSNKSKGNLFFNKEKVLTYEDQVELIQQQMNDYSFKIKKENPDYDDEDIQSIVEQKYLEQIYSLQIKRQNEEKIERFKMKNQDNFLLLKQIKIGGTVNQVVISQDDKLIVCCSDDGKLRIWETETGKLIFQFNEHKGMIKSVAISPGNQYIASGGQDSTVKIYRLRDKEPVIFDLNQKNGGHQSMVVTVCFSEDNRFFASAGTDMIIKLWNGQTFELISNLRGHANSVNQIQFFNLEQKTQLISCSGLKTGLQDFSIKIWNVEAESGTNFFKEIENGHQKPITDVIFTRNNLMLVSLCQGGIIKVFNPINGYLFYTFEAYKYHKSEQKLLCISVSADSRLLFVGGEDGQISVYDLFNGVYKRNTFSKKIQDQVMEDLEKQIQKKRAKFNYQNSQQEKLDNNYNEQENDFIEKYKSKHLAINKIVCTQRESDRLQNYFITCQGEQIVLWEQINQNREIKNQKTNSGQILSLLIDNENKNVLTGTEKGIIDIWFIDTFEHIYQINNIYPVNDMVLSLEMRFLYTCSTDGSIRKIDIRKNTVINKYQEHKSTIKQIEGFYFDNKKQFYFVTSSIDGEIKIWQENQNKSLLTIKESNGSINSLSLSQNGDYFAYGGQDCDIYLHTFIDDLKISGVQERVITSKQVDFSCYNAQFDDVENLSNFNLQRLQIASQKKDIVNKPQLLIVPVTQDTGCTTKVCSIF